MLSEAETCTLSCCCHFYVMLAQCWLVAPQLRWNCPAGRGHRMKPSSLTRCWTTFRWWNLKHFFFLYPLQGCLVMYLTFSPSAHPHLLPWWKVFSFSASLGWDREVFFFYFQPHKARVLIHCVAITRTLVPGWRHRCLSQPLLAEAEVGGGSRPARSPRLRRRGAEVSAQNDRQVQLPSSPVVLWFRHPDSHAFVVTLYLPQSKVRTVSAGGLLQTCPL